MNNRQLLKYFLLFIIAFAIFSFLQYSPTFPDPDSFYHAKIAVLMRDQGIIFDFPWLQFTVLKDYYIDHHFLYHALLVPFVIFLDPLAGIKLATALLATITILTFFWLLNQFKIRGAFLYSLLLLFSGPFIFRINLAKTSSVSLIILMVGLYFIFKRKLWPLFILSFFYVWTYGGWPLILVLTLFYILADSIIKSIDSPTSEIKNHELGINKLIKNSKFKIQNFLRAIFTKTNVKLLTACLGGLAAGIIINPYFPKNLIFYWHQIIKIAVINYRDKIGVGAEWYPYALGDLISNTSLIFVLIVLALVLFFINFIKNFIEKKSGERAKSNAAMISTIAICAAFFLILTLRSRRNVEYFVPFAALAAAFTLNKLFPLRDQYLLSLENWRQRKKFLANTLFVYFIIIIPFTAAQGLWSVKRQFSNGGSTQKYRGVAEWLKNNTPEKSIVFHNDWDDFPALFYYNTHNYYIAGLDPTFMYDYDKRLHKTWVDITTGRRANISEIIKNDFHSEYVFVDKDHIAFENNLKFDGHFKLVYKDEEGKIFKLTKE